MKKVAPLLALACAFRLNAQAADYTQNRHVKNGRLLRNVPRRKECRPESRYRSMQGLS